MKTFLIACTLLIAFFAFAPETEAQTKVNVRFARGKTTGSYNGSIRGQRYMDYVLRARAGQTLRVVLTKRSGAPVYFNVLPSGSEVAIFRPTGGSGGGEWWYLRSSDGANRAFAFGSSTDLTVPGDYTGDGKADLAYFRPSTGEWYVLRSEDSSFFAFPWGTSGDLPAPGDYDGDGKIDAAVFRPSNSNWFALRSTAGPLVLQFGTTGDRPLPNAFVR